jgi:hypothetical protein
MWLGRDCLFLSFILPSSSFLPFFLSCHFLFLPSFFLASLPHLPASPSPPHSSHLPLQPLPLQPKTMTSAYYRKRINKLQEDEDAAELKLGVEFQNEHCLLFAEVKILMEKLKESTEAQNAGSFAATDGLLTSDVRRTLGPYVFQLKLLLSDFTFFCLFLFYMHYRYYQKFLLSQLSYRRSLLPVLSFILPTVSLIFSVISDLSSTCAVYDSIYHSCLYCLATFTKHWDTLAICQSSITQKQSKKCARFSCLLNWNHLKLHNWPICCLKRPKKPRH